VVCRPAPVSQVLADAVAGGGKGDVLLRRLDGLKIPQGKGQDKNGPENEEKVEKWIEDVDKGRLGKFGKRFFH
jgi:hypothetical protein